MFSGKSTAILEIIHKYKSIQWPVFVITHSLDTRNTSSNEPPIICNHNNETAPAYATDTLTSVLNDPNYVAARVVIIEEAQFFTGLKEFILRAVELDEKTVFCVGLDGDVRRRPFGEILALLPYCDTIEKRHAFCKRCSTPTPALFTARHSPIRITPQIEVGGAELYESLCRIHYLEQETVG